MSSIGLWSLLKREVRRVVYAWKSALLPPLITNILYILVFGTILGSRVDDIQGFPYIRFILPGLIGLVAMTSAFNGSSFSVFHARWDDYVSEVLTSSLSYWEMLLGYLGGAVFYGITTGAGITVVALAFTEVTFLHPVLFLAFLVLSCILFACLGIITGLAATEFGHIHTASNFVIMPLVFLGGVFFSTEMIAPAWQGVVLANPIIHVVNGLRYAMLGYTDVAVWTAGLILAGAAGVAFGSTLYLLRAGFGLQD